MRVKVNVVIKLILKDDISTDILIKSLKPDNIGIEETTSITMRKNDDVMTIFIEGEGELGSFIQTIDDLLRCLSVAYRFVQLNI